MSDNVQTLIKNTHTPKISPSKNRYMQPNAEEWSGAKRRRERERGASFIQSIHGCIVYTFMYGYGTKMRWCYRWPDIVVCLQSTTHIHTTYITHTNDGKYIVRAPISRFQRHKYNVTNNSVHSHWTEFFSMGRRIAATATSLLMLVLLLLLLLLLFWLLMLFYSFPSLFYALFPTGNIY